MATKAITGASRIRTNEAVVKSISLLIIRVMIGPDAFALA